MELVDHKDVIRDLKFAPDGSLRLVSASRDGTLKVYTASLSPTGPVVGGGERLCLLCESVHTSDMQFCLE